MKKASMTAGYIAIAGIMMIFVALAQGRFDGINSKTGGIAPEKPLDEVDIFRVCFVSSGRDARCQG